MKRALVLSGGGSRGAYECGAWRALQEMNIRLDAVYGTSIGAMNAALVAQGDYDVALRLWENIRVDQIVSLEEGEEFSVEHMASRKRDLIPFLLENARNFLMDISPMERLMAENIDEGRVRASGMNLGVMITRVPQFSPLEARLNDIPQGRLHDYLLASAACFPIFPLKSLDGELTMDGGYVDNLPISMAISDGAQEIIAIDIHPQCVHPEYTGMPFLTLVHPLHELCGFLDFRPEQLRRARMMGYYDTMKAYGRLDGIRYTFVRVDDLKISAQAREYIRRVAEFDACSRGRGGDAALIRALRAEMPLRRLSWKEGLLRGLELCAQLMGFREDAIYDVEQLTDRILRFVCAQDMGKAPEEREFSAAARAGSRALIACLCTGLRWDDGFFARYARRLWDYPMEAAAALYLDTMRRRVQCLPAG